MRFKVKEAQFMTSAVKPNGYPPAGPPEIAFAGRSNVGKSSLINRLTGRRKLVRVSSRPGRTQQINFFDLNHSELVLVDLPGYGFAKVPPAVRASWGRMVESYLQGRPVLCAVVVILDIRRDPGPEDVQLLDYLNAHGLPAVIALTKADKLSGNKRTSRLAKLRPALARYDGQPVLVSALSGLGMDALWDRLIGLARAMADASSVANPEPLS